MSARRDRPVDRLDRGGRHPHQRLDALDIGLGEVGEARQRP
jgi:hypothetical protein